MYNVYVPVYAADKSAYMHTNFIGKCMNHRQWANGLWKNDQKASAIYK